MKDQVAVLIQRALEAETCGDIGRLLNEAIYVLRQRATSATALLQPLADRDFDGKWRIKKALAILEDGQL